MPERVLRVRAGQPVGPNVILGLAAAPVTATRVPTSSPLCVSVCDLCTNLPTLVSVSATPRSSAPHLCTSACGRRIDLPTLSRPQLMAAILTTRLRGEPAWTKPPGRQRCAGCLRDGVQCNAMNCAWLIRAPATSAGCLRDGVQCNAMNCAWLIRAPATSKHPPKP
eukprot:363982-Chlamydomonas_euryale.AAC.4